jgi:probable rRNA maturation factor
MPGILFFSEGISFKLKNPRKTKSWIKSAIEREHKSLSALNYIFCSDKYLHQINLEYLDHDTLTDIVTFDNSEDDSMIEGDIFISVERVKENSLKFKKTFDDELHRVIIHGALHLIGYSDKSAVAKKQMRKKEDAYLSLR